MVRHYQKGKPMSLLSLTGELAYEFLPTTDEQLLAIDTVLADL